METSIKPSLLNYSVLDGYLMKPVGEVDLQVLRGGKSQLF